MTRRATPLSLRLVVLFGLLVGATLLIVAALVVHLTRAHLVRQLDSQIEQVVASFRSGPGAQVAGSSDLVPAARAWLASTALPPTQFAAVRTADARTLSTAGTLDPDALDADRSRLGSGGPRWWRVDGDGAAVRAVTVPLRVDGHRAGTLVVGASEIEVDGTVSALVAGVGWASGAGLLFAALVGFAAVRRTLRPLSHIAAEAQAIHETGDLSRRVSYEGPHDEVGRLATAFDEMVARLQEAFDSQRRFLADASHELRTPLTIVRGQLELLHADLADERARHSAEVGIEEIDRMSRIVDDLLLLARLQEGLTLESEPVEVELVLQEALLRATRLAPRPATIEAEPSLFATADPDRLLQVLTNLVTNAIQHAGDDATLTLSSRSLGGTVLIDVTDTGRGIPPEDIPHVFDRLYRGARPQTSSPAGAGLGLAIASSLVRAMGGEIRVTSTVGVGTTFTISLARAETSDTAATLPGVRVRGAQS